MSYRIKALAILVLCAALAHPALAAAGDPQDKAGGKDPALFTRMPGFIIYNHQELDFDRYEFPVGPGKTQPVEGRHLYLDYYVKEGIKVPSGLQIARNYRNAAQAAGGQTVYEYEDGGARYITLKIVKGGTEAWAAVEAGDNGMYKVHVVEKKAMSQEVVANAERLAGSIRQTGKAAVYGIYFDTGKAEIKPESEAAIGEIARLLKNDAKLKLYVVGHTDNAGGFDSNVKLSQARAAAVAGALAKRHGVAASRLTPFGAGPAAPAASNTTEEGRAKNRRVELVAQ